LSSVPPSSITVPFELLTIKRLVARYVNSWIPRWLSFVYLLFGCP
jgi:hypothetical protein